MEKNQMIEKGIQHSEETLWIVTFMCVVVGGAKGSGQVSLMWYVIKNFYYFSI